MRTRARLHLQEADPKLAVWIEKVGPCGFRAERTRSAFESFARSIVYQQLNGKAAETIWNRVLAHFPKGLTPEGLLKIPGKKLRAAGLSRNKMLAIQDLAKKEKEGKLPHLTEMKRMSDQEIIERYTEVRGIGVWTVQMFLMFRLGRRDVLPVTDYGVRKGFSLVYGMKSLPAPRTMERAAESWKPYRSFASWYLWRVLDLK